MLTISIIDCAIKQASHGCFNSLVDQLNHKFHYHHPVREGMKTLVGETAVDAYIILGSASNVEDDLPWQRSLADFCLEKLNQDRPVLGICFGHQLLAHCFGLSVKKNPNDRRFSGVREVNIIENSWGFNQGEAFKVFTAHSYCLYETKKGASAKPKPNKLRKIGTSSECEFDIIAHQDLPFLGIQAHPEASDFFIASEIENQSPLIKSEIKDSAKKGGLEIISRFLNHCEKLKHNL